MVVVFEMERSAQERSVLIMLLVRSYLVCSSVDECGSGRCVSHDSEGDFVGRSGRNLAWNPGFGSRRFYYYSGDFYFGRQHSAFLIGSVCEPGTEYAFTSFGGIDWNGYCAAIHDEKDVNSSGDIGT